MRYNTAPSGKGSYWWPRRKLSRRSAVSWRRMSNGREAEGGKSHGDSDAGLLGTFQLRGHGTSQQNKLTVHGKTDPDLSFDVYMKRRKRAEELAARSMTSEETVSPSFELSSSTKRAAKPSHSAGDYDNWVLDSHVEIWRKCAHPETSPQNIELQLNQTCQGGESDGTEAHVDIAKPLMAMVNQPATPDKPSTEDINISVGSDQRFHTTPPKDAEPVAQAGLPRSVHPELDHASLLPDFIALAENASANLEPRIEELQRERIHVLGMGPVGKYIAHSLSRLPHGPPVSLLMHRPLMMQEWYDEGQAIRLHKGSEVLVGSGFDIESSAPFEVGHPERRRKQRGSEDKVGHAAKQKTSVISHLIVTTDPSTTISALSNILHRIRKQTSICLVQDGLGMVEKLNSLFFPDPNRRPSYILANIDHGLVSTDKRFTLIEKRPGKMECSIMPIRTRFEEAGVPISRHDFSWSDEAKHLVTSLYRSPALSTTALGHKQFYKEQLLRIAVNAIIGPLTVAFDCRNDQLLYNFSASSIMTMLIREISTIVLSMPEFPRQHQEKKAFSPHRLEQTVVGILKRTGTNNSAMLTAVRRGDRTNVQFVNGYLMKRAADLDIASPLNEMVMHMVKAKQTIKRREIDGYIPVER